VSKKIALFALAIILGLVNWSIATKEKQLAEGKTVYLELAPVDPRSLMQGDYMALRFCLANEVYDALPKAKNNQLWHHDVSAPDGYVVVSLDERSIGSFKRLYKGQALAADEVLMRYRVRNGAVKFATNAFFFQEGQGKYYQPARYGQFRVDDKGELLLVAMFDKDLNKLGPKNSQNHD
jgi:uncharacterized membrane-anchored protein